MLANEVAASCCFSLSSFRLFTCFRLRVLQGVASFDATGRAEIDRGYLTRVATVTPEREIDDEFSVKYRYTQHALPRDAHTSHDRGLCVKIDAVRRGRRAFTYPLDHIR